MFRAETSPVRSIIDASLAHFPFFTHGDGTFPVIAAPSQGERSDTIDSIHHEVTLFSGVEERGPASAGLTFASSPHTVSTLQREKVLQATSKKIEGLPTLITENNEIAAHLIVWWWGEKGARYDIQKLAPLSDRERAPFLDNIAAQLTTGIDLMQDSLDLPKDQTTTNIQVYGLLGHATAEERQKEGLSRGSQSNPNGHINITYIPTQEITESASTEHVNLAELIKQIGPWDTVLFDLCKGAVSEKIRSIVETRTNNNPPVEVRTNQDHSIRSDGKAVRFFEGYRMRFDEPITTNAALHILLDIVNQYEEYYQKTQFSYREYHKNIGNKNKRDEIKADILSEAENMGFTNQIGEHLTDLILNIPPTYGQITTWAEELREEGRSNDDVSLRILQGKKRSYKMIEQRLHTPEGKAFYKRGFQRMYGANDFEADILIRMAEDRIKSHEQYQDIQFTFPPQLSCSYLLEWGRNEQGNINIHGISLATRLGSTKGALADLAGVVIRRTMGI
jgi:hypothetical protein